jgi:hypothetical protein
MLKFDFFEEFGRIFTCRRQAKTALFGALAASPLRGAAAASHPYNRLRVNFTRLLTENFIGRIKTSALQANRDVRI